MPGRESSRMGRVYPGVCERTCRRSTRARYSTRFGTRPGGVSPEYRAAPEPLRAVPRSVGMADLGAFLSSRPGILAGLAATIVSGFAGAALLPTPWNGGVVMVVLLALVFAITRAQRGRVPGLGLGRPASWPRTLGLAVAWSAVAFVVFRLLLEGLLERWTGVERDLSRFAFLEGDVGALLRTLPLLWVTAALR